MTLRSQRSAPERHARSLLAQLITQQPFLRGSLVERARSCGKPTCRCQRGQLHRSLYLAVRQHGQPALLYIPRALEATVRQWVANGRSLAQQVQALHQQHLEQLLQRKQQLSTRPTKAKADQPDSSP